MALDDRTFQGKKDRSDYRIGYNRYIILWRKYIDAYSGGINIKQEKYLPKDYIESIKDYNIRFNQSFYSNHTQKVITDYDKYLWKNYPLREGLTYYESMIRFYSENGDEISTNDYFRQLNRKVHIYGEMFGIIGHDEIPAGTTLNDTIRKQLGLKYIVAMTNPINVPVYNQDRIIIDTDINKYIEINHKGIGYFEDDKLVKVNYINYPVLPVFRAYIDDNNDGFGESLIRDISDMNIAIYQLESSLLVDFKKQTYSPFLMPISSDIQKFLFDYYGTKRNSFKNPDGTLKDEDTIEFKIQEVMPVPSGGFEGKFLTKDTTFIDQKKAYIETLKQEIRNLASQRFEELRAQSGIAKYMDIEDSNTALYMLSTYAKQTEYKFWQLWFSIATPDKAMPENINIQYFTDFNIKDYEKDIQIKKDYLKDYFDASQTATIKMMNTLINDIENYTSKEKEQIIKELNIYIQNKALLKTISSLNTNNNINPVDTNDIANDADNNNNVEHLDNYGNQNIVNRELTRAKGIVKGGREDEKFNTNI